MYSLHSPVSVVPLYGGGAPDVVGLEVEEPDVLEVRGPLRIDHDADGGGIRLPLPRVTLLAPHPLRLPSHFVLHIDLEGTRRQWPNSAGVPV